MSRTGSNLWSLVATRSPNLRRARREFRDRDNGRDSTRNALLGAGAAFQVAVGPTIPPAVHKRVDFAAHSVCTQVAALLGKFEAGDVGNVVTPVVHADLGNSALGWLGDTLVVPGVPGLAVFARGAAIRSCVGVTAVLTRTSARL